MSPDDRPAPAPAARCVGRRSHYVIMGTSAVVLLAPDAGEALIMRHPWPRHRVDQGVDGVATTRPSLPARRHLQCRRAAAPLVAAVAAAALGLTVWSATPAAPPWTQSSADAAPSGPPQTVAARPKANTLNAANGEVRALTQVGNRIYLGGTFTKVGPAQLGAAGVLQTGTHSFAAHFPDVSGVVFATAPDGHGGWFVGGQFSSVGGQTRRNLAHITAQGRVSAWNPRPDAPVRALALVGRGLVVAGDFTHLGSRPAAHLVRLGLTRAHVQWAGALNGDALSLALSADRSTVYVGGSFTGAGSAARSHIAAFDARSGRLRAGFHPSADAPVRALAVLGRSVWLGGDFGVVAGKTRHHLASVTSVGTLRRTPAVDGPVLALAADGAHHRVFLGGSFSHVGGLVRPRFADVSVAASNGHVGAVRLNAPTGDVRALAVTHRDVYLAGDFQASPAKTAPAVIARMPLSGHRVDAAVPFEAAPASLTRAAQAGGGVFALAAGPRGRLVVAGDFSDYGLVARRHIAAFNADTGALDRRFRPTVDGPVYTMKSSASGSALFLGGAFKHVDGAARKNLARIGSARGGLDRAFRADASAFVKDMAVGTNGRLFVAGPFLTIDGKAAGHLAAISASSGHVLGGFNLPVTEPTNDVSDGVRAIALSPDGATLAVVGNFGRIGAANRPLVALVDVAASPATVRPWRTTLYDTPCGLGRVGFMRDVDVLLRRVATARRQRRELQPAGVRRRQRLPRRAERGRRHPALDRAGGRQHRVGRGVLGHGLHRRPLPRHRPRHLDRPALPHRSAGRADRTRPLVGAERQRLPWRPRARAWRGRVAAGR